MSLKTVRMIIALVLLVILGSGCAALKDVGGIAKVPGGQVESESVSFTDLFEEDEQIRLLVSNALECFLTGAQKFFEATDNKEMAQKCEKGVEDLQANPKDPQTIKNVTNTIDSTLDKIKMADNETKVLDTTAKKELGLGIIMIGAAGINDGIAGGKAAKFFMKAKDGLALAQKNPLKHSKEIVRIKDSMELMKFLSENLPLQSAAIGQSVDGMIKFAKANEVTVTTEEISNEAKKMLKG